PLHLGEIVDATAVDGQHKIAGLEAGLLGGTARRYDIDTGSGVGLAVEHGEPCEDCDRHEEIGDRTSRHDSGASLDALAGEALLPPGLAHLRDGGLVPGTLGGLLA